MIAALARLRARLGLFQLSPRERAALAVLAAIIMIAGAAMSFDWAERTRLSAEEARLARYDSSAAGQARGDIQAALARARAMSVRAPTAPLAAVRAETLAADAAARAGFEASDIVVAPLDGAADGAGAMRLSVEGPFEWRSMIAFVDLLSRAPVSFAPIAAELRDGAQFRFEALAPFERDETRP